jgi:hypothetical protein
MSIMLEVLFHAPTNLEREARIATALKEFGGRLTYKEEPATDSLAQTVCLTYEFDDRRAAEAAANQLRNLGEHVDGTMDYGDGQQPGAVSLWER